MIGSKSPIPVEISDRGEAGVAVYMQDQTTESLDVPFLLAKGSFELASDTTVDTRSFTATEGHGIVVGDVIEFANSVTFMQATVLTVVTNTITLDSLINHVYTSGDTMTRSSDDLRVDGSSSPVLFKVKPLPGQSGDFTRIILRIESTSAMDYTKFGSETALTTGCLLRIKRGSGDYRNITNWKSNGDFIEHSFDALFQSKTGGGGFGFVGRSTFAGQQNRGVVIRLEGSSSEELQIVVQDDITTGLLKLTAIAQGHELQL